MRYKLLEMVLHIHQIFYKHAALLGLRIPHHRNLLKSAQFASSATISDSDNYHQPSPKTLTCTAISDTVCLCHGKTRFSTSAILRRHSRSHRINAERYRSKHIARHNTSSSPFFEGRGDRTVVVSWRQSKKTSQTTQTIQPHRSPLLDSGPVNFEAMPRKTVSHSRYWSIKHGTSSKATVSTTGSA